MLFACACARALCAQRARALTHIEFARASKQTHVLSLSLCACVCVCVYQVNTPKHTNNSMNSTSWTRHSPAIMADTSLRTLEPTLRTLPSQLGRRAAHDLRARAHTELIRATCAGQRVRAIRALTQICVAVRARAQCGERVQCKCQQMSARIYRHCTARPTTSATAAGATTRAHINI